MSRNILQRFARSLRRKPTASFARPLGRLEALEARDVPAAVPFDIPSYHGGAYSTQAWGNVSGDFNGDGNIDMVLAGSAFNSLTYMQGNGDGTFQPERLMNAGTDVSSQGIVAVDYDSDGDKDLLVYEYTQATLDGTADEGTITLYRNDGSANFTREVVKSGLMEGYQIAAGDLNGDGLADVAYSSNRYISATSTTIAVKAFALQQPDGQLGASTTLTNVPGGAVTISDVNSDGDLDIVTAGYTQTVIPPLTIITTNELKVFHGNGDGTLAAPFEVTTGNFPEVTQIVDLNGDGRKDLLVWHRPSGAPHIVYFPQQADGSFGAPVGLLPTTYNTGFFTEVADVNEDSVPDIVSYSLFSGAYRVSWVPGLGGGSYGVPVLITQSAAGNAGLHVVDLDNDSHLDIITVGGASTARPAPVAVLLNKTGENPMVLIPPAARTRVAGDPIDVQVYFGFPITLTGTPRVALDVGGSTVFANYLSGSGTPTLTFRYTVTAADLDLDGVQLASNLIDLNGGTMLDPEGGAAVLEFPNLPFSGVIANGRGPLVQSITRLDSQSTTAGTVRFAVQFPEDVTGVDVSDFAVRMNAGDLAGASVQSVTGTGSVYEVTVSTGSGSGTLGLSVNDTASIFDLSGDVLGKGYPGGEVYTVRPTPVGVIDTYYVEGHADYRPVYTNGEFTYVWHGASVIPSDEVITYLDNTAIVNRPAGTNYDFIGVGDGQPYYLSNSSGNIASVPFLGWSGESLVANEFADYRPTDPRITSATLREYVKVQMVGFRSSSGGDFSLYSGSTPTVWFATSDGIGSTDNIWLYRTHFHRNTAFSKPGTYEIDVVISGYLDGNQNNALDATDVYVESGIKTMVFHVDVPVAEDDTFTVSPQNTLLGSVTLNDTRFNDPSELTATVIATTTQGALTLNPNGSFTYVPSATFNGFDSFIYQVENARGGTDTATVTIALPGGQQYEAIISTGHVDLGIGYEDGWDLHIHDEEGDAEYEPYDAVLHVGSAAISTRSDGLAGGEYDFLGVPVGETFYRLPQTENPELPFLGIGTEEIEDGTFLGGEVQLRLKAVNGPGHFSMWFTTDTGPEVRFATADGITTADVVTVMEGGHDHYNFAFSKRGSYEVTFEAFATLPDGSEVSSGNVTYRFLVNSEAEPEDDGYSVDEDGTLTVGGPGLLGNDSDPDGDALVSTLVHGPANGTVTVNADGSFTYVPNANFNGTDTFTYAVTDVRYRIVPLGTLGGTQSFALDVNNNRQVSGNSLVVSDPGSSGSLLRAYLWTDGGMTNLGSMAPIPPSTSANRFGRGYAVNDWGVVVGEFNNDSSRAFVYGDGAMSGLIRLAGDNDNGVASDINNHGVIVGSSSNGTASRPTIWNFDGTTYIAADLGTIAGTSTSTGRAWAINDAGQIVGLSQNPAVGTSQATLWDGGTITNLGSLGNGERFSQAYGLNNHGDIVGASSTGQTVGELIGTTSSTSITRAFFWHHDHFHELLPTNFYAPGNTGATTNYHSEAKDINDAGVVVGNSARIAGFNTIATIWVGGAAIDLNSLVPTGSGWVLRSAEGINLGGDIVGFGTFGGTSRAFMVVPEVVGPHFSRTATVTITVNPEADPPDAVDDAYTVGAGASVHGNVLFNDSDPDGDPVSVVSTTDPGKGAVVVQTNGSFVYTPGESFDGTDSFTYTISDGLGGTGTATVTITGAAPSTFEAVLSTGHVDIGIFAGGEDTIIDHGDHQHIIEGEFGWDLHIHDEESDDEYHPDEALLLVRTEAMVSRPGGSEFDFIGVGAGETYWRLPQTQNPEVLYLGIGTEEIEDGTFLGGQIHLRLKAVNGPGHFSMWESTDTGPAVFMATSDGITADDLATILEGGHSHYNWAFTATGRYEITFEAFGSLPDGAAVSSGDVTYFFHVNAAPVAVDESYAVTPGNDLQGNVMLNDADADGDPLTAAYLSGAVNGTLALNANGTFTYTPGVTFNGTDTFTYSIDDGNGGTATATVTINLAASPHFVAAISTGHVDLGIGYEDGEWDLHIHDEENEAEYEPDQAFLKVGPVAIATRSDGLEGSEFDFLGVTAGGTFFRLPQTENPALPFVGIGAEEVADGTFLGGEFQLRLKAVNGPGHFSMWQSADTGPDVRFATSDGVTAADFATALEGGHQHYNFAFTARGSYDVTVEAVGILPDGTVVSSGDITYRFVVPLPNPVAIDIPIDGTVQASGPSGTTTVTPFPGYTGPIHTASTDVNGDGVADMIAAVGAEGAPHVKVIDGATGAELRSFYAYDPSFTGGVLVAAGDVTGDGVPDIMTASGAGAGPHVKVFDGVTGAEVRSFFAYDASYTGGVSVAVGDVDGDGRADIVTGTISGAPHVKAFSGATGVELLSYYAYAPTFTGGVFVAAGDLDGDGQAEIVTGTGVGGGSHVKIFDGSSGTERGGFMAYGEGFRGGVRVAVVDTEADGKSEIVTGAGPGGGPHVKLFDGQTFAELDSFLAADPTFAGGVFVG